MANNFNILAKVQLQGPNNIKQIARQIQSQLSGINANVKINIANNTNQKLNAVNTTLQKIDASIKNIRASSIAANAELIKLSATIQAIRKSGSNININTKINAVANSARNAAGQMRVFGEQAALAVRRFTAFAVPTTVFLGLISAIKEGVVAAIDFEKEMVRLSQVTGRSISSLAVLSDEITRLSTSLGVSSKDLGNVATTLAQAGLSAKKTTVALEALARSSLAATFTSIEDTTEGAIAVFRQFNVEAEDLQGVIGSLNSVSAQFAVESDDLVSVIRRTGGAFKASGGSLNELLGLFTSVRATTRESADSIATGFRTIFTRIQRPRTIQFLKELGVQLQDAKGQFIGPLESIRRLNAALSEVPTTDPRFAAVIEELGGFRQVSKVIPLIQQFPEALKAINVAEQGQLSIVEDSIIAQKSLANEIAKVREEFLALFREISSDKSFQLFVRTVLELAKGLIAVTKAIKPLVPLIGSLLVIQGARGLSQLGQGFATGIGGGRGGRRRFAEGGIVPGTGNSDTVPAMLTPGEFVVKKSAAKAIGFSKLAAMNKFAKGGQQKKKKNPFSKIKDSANIDEHLAVAGLLPVGSGKKEEYFKFRDKSLGIDKNIKLTLSSLSKPASDELKQIYEDRLFSAVSSASDVLRGKIGEKTSSSADIGAVLSKAGLDNIVGSLFESTLAVAGATYDEKISDKDPIDFPQGLGPKIGSLFSGLPFYIPTDAKRTASSRDFKRRNLVSYLKKKYAKVKVEAAAQSSPQNIGRKNIIASSKSDDTTEANFLSAYNSLSDEQKRRYVDYVSKKNSRSAIEANFPGTGLFYLSDKKASGFLKNIGVLKKASGGTIPGTGNEDKVPALLTPGEFVINKRAAQRIGINNLNKMNNADKVQKFARGGRVGRGFDANFTNIGLVTSGIFSLTSSFSNLDKETQKAVDSFSAVALAATGLSFTLRAFTSDRKLLKERKIGTLGIDPLTDRVVQKKGGVRSSLAKNFDLLSGAVSTVSALFVVAGQAMQESALAAAKNAKNQNELNNAISNNTTGSTISGAGVGAGLGAAIGTAIAPGIGTAIGAGVGALGGAITGVLTSNNKELVKAFNQVAFDKRSEKLEDLFDDFNNNRIDLGSSAANISRSTQEQLNEIRVNPDLEQRAELTKQLKGNIVNYRTLSSSIAKNVGSLDEFKSSYDSSGSKLIESLSYLTNKSFKDIENEIQKEIEARNESIEAQKKQAAINAQLQSYTVSIKTLSDAFLSISDRINEAQSSIDGLIASIEGGFSGSKFSGISNDLFARAIGGGINNVGQVSTATRNLTASLDKESQDKIVSSVTSVTTLSNALPDILTKIANNVGLGADIDRAEEQFAKALDNLPGVDKQLKDVAKSIFASELASREASGDAGFRKVAREDVLGLADKLIPEALKTFVQGLDEINKTAQGIIGTLSDRITKASQIQLDIAKKRADLEDKIFEVDKFRLAAGKEVQLSDVSNVVNRRRRILLGENGLSPGANTQGTAYRILKLQAEKEAAQNRVSTAGLGTQKQKDAIAEVGKLEGEIARLAGYLNDLSSSTAELTHLQEELAKAEADRKAGKDLVQGLLFGEGKDRVKFVDSFKNILDVKNGNKNFLDFNQNQRKDFLDLLGQLPENRASVALGGLKPQEFLNDLIRKSFVLRAQREGANVGEAEQLAKELTTRTKVEEDIRKKMIEVMEKSNEAETALLVVNKKLAESFEAFNNKSLQELPTLIRNAISESAIAGLQQTQRFQQDKREEVGSRLNAVTQIANQLGITEDNVKTVGNLIKNNQSNFENISKFSNIRDLFGTPSNSAANLRLAKAADSAGFFSGKLSPEIAATLADQAITADPLLSKYGNFAESSKKLQEKIQAFSVNPKILGEDDNLTPRERLAKFLDKSINEIKSITRTEAIQKVDSSQRELEKNLKGTFVGRTDTVISQLTNTENLKKFLDTFELANVPLTKAKDEFANLNAQIAQTSKEIELFRAKIAVVENNKIGLDTVLRPVQKAAGGIIGGKSISSSLTTFTPKGTDRIPAILSRGEYVVNAAATKANLGLLESINAQGFANGGYAEMMAKRRKAYQASIQARRENVPEFIKNIRKRKAINNQNAINRNVRSDPRNIRAVGNALNTGLNLFGVGNIFAGNNVENANRQPLQGEAAREFFAREKEAANASRGQRTNQQRFVELDRNDVAARQALEAMGVSVRNRPLSGVEAREFFSKERDRVRQRVRGFATGGPVPGSGNRDSVPALLTPGEFVLNRRAAKSIGLHSLANFNQKFANGGVVTGSGGGAGGTLNINPQALATLEKFYGTFTDAISLFGSSIGTFTQSSNVLANALSNWGGAATRLSEALASMPHEIQVSHAPMNVVISVTGLETFRQEITNEVLAAMDQRLSTQRTKAADGKSPFMSK